MNELAFLTVEIAGQLVALDVDHVQAVLPMDEIVPVPLAPPTVVGITTKRGHVLTVIDARAAIVPDKAPVTHQSVVIKVNGHRYALLVDSIDEVISVDRGEVALPPPGMSGVWATLATGMIRLEGGRLALVIHPGHFVEVPGVPPVSLNHPLTHDALHASSVA